MTGKEDGETGESMMSSGSRLAVFLCHEQKGSPLRPSSGKIESEIGAGVPYTFISR